MHSISAEHLSLERVKEILDKHEKLVLSKEATEAVVKCREYLDRKMEDIGRPVYGITTGFGSLYNVTIPRKDLSQLHHNLVMSHACGIGEDQCLNTEHAKDPYIENNCFYRITFIIMESSVHHEDVLAGQISGDQLSRMTGSRGSREIRDVRIRYGKILFTGICQGAQAGTQDNADLRNLAVS